jgi:hypothetical protein
MLADLLHLDDLAGTIAKGLGGIAHPSPNTLGDLGVYRHGSLDTLFERPTHVPTVCVTPRWSLPAVISEDLVFPSLHLPIEPAFRTRYRTEYRDTHTVYARRIRPAAVCRRPRLLYLHGYLQPETYVEEMALAGMAVRLGMEIVQLQPPYHGRRTPRGAYYGGEFFCTADLVRTIEALRQGVLDARTLLGWLLAKDDAPVGVVGLSLGGLLTSILTCVEARFAFAIPLIAHMDLDALLRQAPILEPMRRELAQFGWRLDDTRELVAQMGWYELRPQLPPDRIHLFAASDDRLFDAAVVDDLWRRWGRPAIRWYPSSHLGFLAHFPDVVRRIATFVDGLDLQSDGAYALRPVA